MIILERWKKAINGSCKITLAIINPPLWSVRQDITQQCVGAIMWASSGYFTGHLPRFLTLAQASCDQRQIADKQDRRNLKSFEAPAANTSAMILRRGEGVNIELLLWLRRSYSQGFLLYNTRWADCNSRPVFRSQKFAFEFVVPPGINGRLYFAHSSSNSAMRSDLWWG